MKQKESARTDEVVQAATDNREFVFLFFFTFLLFPEDMTGGLGREEGIKSLEKEAK
jgi:hypothetical protein